MVLASFTVEGVLTMLLWAVIAVLNFWIWSKAKANANLLMMIGAAWLALASLLLLFNAVLLGVENYGWTQLLGVGCLAAGFYLSVKPMVAANIAQLQSKVKETMGKKGGGAPPSA
jgi:hypothetical protein